jgi:hypothetical protein
MYSGSVFETSTRGRGALLNGRCITLEENCAYLVCGGNGIITSTPKAKYSFNNALSEWLPFYVVFARSLKQQQDFLRRELLNVLCQVCDSFLRIVKFADLVLRAGNETPASQKFRGGGVCAGEYVDKSGNS